MNDANDYSVSANQFHDKFKRRMNAKIGIIKDIDYAVAWKIYQNPDSPEINFIKGKFAGIEIAMEIFEEVLLEFKVDNSLTDMISMVKSMTNLVKKPIFSEIIAHAKQHDAIFGLYFHELTNTLGISGGDWMEVDDHKFIDEWCESHGIDTYYEAEASDEYFVQLGYKIIYNQTEGCRSGLTEQS